MALTCAEARSPARNGCRRSRTMAAPAAARAARSRSNRSRRSCVPKNAATSAGYVTASPVARRSARTPSSAAASRWPTGVPSTSNCSRCDRSSATAASRVPPVRANASTRSSTRRKRLGAERQRVERLKRQTRVGEHLLREIEIRQRALEHDRDRIRPRAPAVAQSRAGCPRDVAQLLFAIAADEDASSRGPAGRMSTGGGGRLVPPRFLLDAGQLLLEAIAKSRVVRLVGDDDVEPRDRRAAGRADRNRPATGRGDRTG